MGTRERSASRSQMQTGRFEQMLHTISNELVEEALENDCTHIVFEQLNGIRERLPYAKAVHKVGVPPTLRVRHVQSRVGRAFV